MIVCVKSNGEEVKEISRKQKRSGRAARLKGSRGWTGCRSGSHRYGNQHRTKAHA
jgi:hypothetical protein